MSKRRPNQHITLSALEPLVKSPPSGTKTFIWDDEVRGFGAYKNKDGRPTFVYQYRMTGGTSQRVTIGQLGELTIKQARIEASKLAHERRMGIDPIAARKEAAIKVEAETGMVIATYFEEYRERRLIAKPLKDKQVTVFRRDLLAHLGNVRLDRLTPAIVDRFKKELLARGPSMVRSGLVCLNTLINDGVKRGTLTRTEAHAFDIPKSGRRQNRIDGWQAVHIYEAGHDLGGVRGDIVEVLLRMGKRKEEIAELQWSEIDLETRQWRLSSDRNKGGRPHLILLPRQVCEIIVRQQPDPAKRQGPVFTINGRTPTEMGSQVKDLIDANLHRRIEFATERGGPARKVDHYTLHDLRKVASSILAEEPFEFSRVLINAMLLHATGDPLDEIYILTKNVRETGRMMQVWNDHFDEMIASPDGWPGGRNLPRMNPAERRERLADLRKEWPRRADQKRAEELPKTRKRRRRRSDG